MILKTIQMIMNQDIVKIHIVRTPRVKNQSCLRNNNKEHRPKERREESVAKQQQNPSNKQNTM